MKVPRSVVAAVLLLPSLVASKAILGVDLGSLYMKVALVQRGAPLEIVTNLHSKRKTENMVLFDADQRLFGADANALYGRKPQKTPAAMTVMLGRDDQHPTVKVLAERHYPIMPSYNETRSGVHLTVDGQVFTPEELVAMVLVHAKDITAAYGGEQGTALPTIKDVVLTVPSFATQHERKALVNAAELADLNVLSLIDENTAAALHYGMDKVLEEPQILVFYNLGASSTQVSVVRFFSQKYKESKYSKETTVGAFQVLGKAWDETLGGMAFDHEIVEFLADEFNQNWKNKGEQDVRNYPRAMAKLRIEAKKVKQVLSANTEIPIYIDGLHDDTALQSHINRAKLEEMCHALFERAVAPIGKAMAAANVTLEQVDGIELIGGGMRVPRIQEEISKFLENKIDLGMHINSDESMALGASFHGANISTAFKVRHVGMTDINPFAIGIHLQDLHDKDKDDDEWDKKATMFKSGTKLGVKKTIAFTHDRDVHCAIDYEDNDFLPKGTEHSLARYKIAGIEEFAKEMDEKKLGKPKVSLQFELSSSGITELIKAEAAVEETFIVEEEVEIEVEEEEQANATTDDNATADKDDEKKDDATADKDEKKDDASTDKDEKKEGEKKDDEKAEEASAAKKEEDKPKKEKKTEIVKKEKKKTHKATLSVDTYHVGRIQPYSEETMAESRFKLAELARKDKGRQMLEESRNNVESYIYKIKNKLVDDEDNINKATTKKQREEIKKLAEAAEEWMYDDGYSADLATMEAKFEELSTPAEKIWFRVAEMTARPAAIEALEKKLGKVVELMKKWEETMPQVTEEERSDVLAKVETIKQWVKDVEEKQGKTKPHDDPHYTSEEVPVQTKTLEALVGKLSRKPKPKPPKKNDTKTEDKAENDTETLDIDVDAEAIVTEPEEANETEAAEAKEGEDEASKTEEPVGEEL